MADLILPKSEVTPVERAGECIVAERDGLVLVVIGDTPILKMPPDAARAFARAVDRKADEAQKVHRIEVPSIT